MSYLILHLKATGASMMQSPSIFSPAPVMAGVMFARALDHRLRGLLGVNGVGLVHLDCTPRIEYLTNTNGFAEPRLIFKRGACLFGDDVASSGSGPSQNSVQPEPLCDYDWMLLVACAAPKYEGTIKSVRQAVNTMRFAGGQIVDTHVDMAEEWEEASRHLTRGFWLDDATHLMADAANPVEALLGFAQKSAPDQGWLLPANLGYALLEKPTVRVGARDGKSHAFGESMIGLVRLTPVRRVLTKEGLNIHKRLWRYGWSGSQFIVTNHPEYAISNQSVEEE